MLRVTFSLLVAAVLACLVSSQTSSVQWGYSLQCPLNTLDYPCLISLTGTATINSTLATIAGTSYQYYQMTAFTGTRTLYTRFGTAQTSQVTLAPLNEIGSANRLVLNTAALSYAQPGFRLNQTVQFPGGLFGSEVRLIVTTGYATESIALIGNSNTNSENSDPTTVQICSTAPGVVASSYVASTEAAAFFTTMAPCQAGPTFAVNAAPYTTAQSAPGLKVFAFSYTITDGVSFSASIASQVSTDGTINYDQLGNLYYNVIQISGTRKEQSLLNASATTTVFITSLMAPNIIATSNIAYITNNNRIYPQYPFLDRYGIAYTVNGAVGTPDATPPITQPELEDGSISQYTNVVGAYIYRLDTLDEQGLDGQFAYPPFNTNNANQNALTLTPLAVPSVYQLVQFCYVMYGLPNTLDYPWSVVMNGTALINNTLVARGTVQYGVPAPQYVYDLLGFVGTRTYTNRFGGQLVNAVTFDQLGEDANVGLLSPYSPYTVSNSVSFHLNGTIQTAGGLPATDISFFLDPYPIEGTGYGIGVGTGTNALNCDPSRTLFVSNMPLFTPSTYSNSNPASLAGNVTGTTDLSQCRATFTTIAPAAASVTAPGVRAITLSYNITGSGGVSSVANLQVITDGSVDTDQLGNTYYTAAAITGSRQYYNYTGALLSNVTVTAVAPLCSGPTVSNLDNVYCNNNRIYPQYPYVDRLGLAYQVSSPVTQEGGTVNISNVVGVIVYRQDVLEEAHATGGGNPTFNSGLAANTNISAVQSSALAAQYFNFSWGYVMYCPTSALEYPCAVSVVGTAIAVVGSQFLSVQVPGSTYGPLANQAAYQIVGFVGTRTFTNRYGETQTAFLSLEPAGEDFADDYLYLAQPYVDSDGPTFRLNGTDQALTEVIGGQVTNEINVFINPNPVEGIAVYGTGSSAIVYNASRTVICSTLPGFVPAAYNASTQFSAGSSSMSACLPQLTTVSKPTFTDSVTPTVYTFGYTVSNGLTYTVQTIVTLTTDGRAHADALGNRYSNVIAANGTRTYYTNSTVVTAAITGVTTVVIHPGFLTGNRTLNRIYPFASPFIDALGLGFTLATPAPITGATVSNTTAYVSTVAVFQFKDYLLEEYPYVSTPSTTYQSTAIAGGIVSNLSFPFTPTTVASNPGYLCVLFYSLPGTVDYPWSAALSFNLNVLPNVQSRAGVQAVQLAGGSGSLTYTNRFGTSFTTPFTVASSTSSYLYLGGASPLDTNGLTLTLAQAIQAPGHGPSAPVNRISIYNSSVGLVLQDFFRIDPAGEAYLSNIAGFTNVTIGAANINALAANYATCQAPITFTNGLRPPTQPSASNGALRFAYNYFISDGQNYSVQGNLTITTASQFATQADQLGNPYQVITGVTGTRLYTYLPTGQTVLSQVTGVSNASYAGVDERFYPYALLSSAPGVYTINSAPFFDYDGLGFSVTPAIPQNGVAPGVGTQYSATNIYFSSSEASVYLAESYDRYTPNVAYQQQSYSFLA